MNIQMGPIARPVPYARNARKISAAAVDKVAASIKEFGWRQPIVVDGEGVILVGHCRLLAAQKLALAEVPVQVADNLTPAQAKSYRLMDNRSHEEAEWDKGLLIPEIAELQALSVDMLLTGFDVSELDAFAVKAAAVEEGNTDADDAPQLQPDPVTVPGEVWQLGRHRLLCGDSTSIHAFEKWMAGGKADLVVTDPPYNVADTGKTKDALTIENDSMGGADFGLWIRRNSCDLDKFNSCDPSHLGSGHATDLDANPFTPMDG